MNKVPVLLMIATMTLCMYEGTSLATEWYRPEMLQAFGKPGDKVIPQEWATPEALKAFGKPGDTVGNPAISKAHKHHNPTSRKHRGTRTNRMPPPAPRVPGD